MLNVCLRISTTAFVFIFYMLSISAFGANFKRPILNTYMVEGIAPVEEQNFETARIQATAEAIKNAVRLAVISTAGLELFNENREEIALFIDENYERYTHGYRVQDETAEDEYFSVSMSVTVFTASIKKGLDRLELGSIVRPLLILVLIDDKASPIYSRDNFLTQFSVSEDAIIRDLTKEGFNVIGRNKISYDFQPENIIAAFRGDIEMAVSLGQSQNANIVILGSTKIIQSEEENKPEGARIELNLRVISIQEKATILDKKEFGISMLEDPILASAQALRDAGKKVALFFLELFKKDIDDETVASPFSSFSYSIKNEQ